MCERCRHAEAVVTFTQLVVDAGKASARNSHRVQTPLAIGLLKREGSLMIQSSRNSPWTGELPLTRRRMRVPQQAPPSQQHSPCSRIPGNHAIRNLRRNVN